MAYTYKSLKVTEDELEDTLNSYSEQGWELDKREVAVGSSPRTYDVLLRTGEGGTAAPAETINFDINSGDVYSEPSEP